MSKVESWFERITDAVSKWPSLGFFALVIAPMAAGLAVSLILKGGFSMSFIAIGWSFSVIGTMIASMGFMNRGIRCSILRQDISLSVIRGLQWIDFEYFIGGLFTIRGYGVQHNGLYDRDGGIDLILHKDRRKIFVQCKQFRREPVGVVEARALYGVMIRGGADEAWLVTSGSFSDAVMEEFDDDPKLKLVGPSLIMEEVAKISKDYSTIPKSARDELLDVTNRIVETSRKQDFVLTIPRCPECRERMVLRHRKDGSGSFWGCSKFNEDNCKGLVNLSDKEKEYLAPSMIR